MTAAAHPLLDEAEHLQRQWRLDEAETRVRDALARGAPEGRARYALSILLAQQGLGPEGFAEAGRALLADPFNRPAWHNWLTLAKLDPGLDPATFADMHREFGAFFAATEDVLHLGVPRDPDAQRPLRIAYLAPNAHLAMNRFLAPFLGVHDAERCPTTAWWGGSVDLDALAAEFPHATHRAMAGLDDAGLAAALAADRVDVAVDLAGHGAFSPLFALQRRPAPVQVTWLDYLATTGLPAMDWRLTDAVADPSGNERFHTEHLARLASAPWCFDPWPQAPAHDPALPADASGHVTFGGVVAALKLGDRTLALWRAALEAVPGSRLVVAGVPGVSARTRILRALGDALAPRVELHGRLALREYLALVATVDVGLDSHPFSGATSTLDCLALGVPVVTRAGVLPFSRSTASIAATLGLDDLVATTDARFAEIVAALAADRPRLRDLRATLPGRLRASPLGDAARFARGLEDCWRGLWRRWLATCDDTHVAPAAAPPNHRAEQAFRRAQRARAAGDVRAAKALLRDALGQLPGLANARRDYWGLVLGGTPP